MDARGGMTTRTKKAKTKAVEGSGTLSLIEVIDILSRGEGGVFDKMLPDEVVISNKTLRGFVNGVGNNLGLRGLTVVIPAYGMEAVVGSFKQHVATIKAGYEKWAHHETLRKWCVIVGVRATTPERKEDRVLFYTFVRDLLGKHVETLKVLDLTLKMPKKRPVLDGFITAMQNCNNVTKLRMHATGIVFTSGVKCGSVLARKLEGIVGGMTSLKTMEWTGMHFQSSVPANQVEQVLLAKLPPSIESVAIDGLVTRPMGEANLTALAARFASDSLKKLVHFNLSGYEALLYSLHGEHVYFGMGHERSNVQKLTMPKEWGHHFNVNLDKSLLAVAARGAAMINTGKRFTIVVSSEDAAEKNTQMTYIENLLRTNNMVNLTVEFPEGSAGRQVFVN